MAPFITLTRGVIIACYLLIISSPATKVVSREVKSANLTLAEEYASPASTTEGAREKHVPTRLRARTTLGTQQQHGCWVFHHMVKSGGSTTKSMIRGFSRRSSVVRSEFANAMWLEGRTGKSAAENIMRTGEGIIYGGYAEALRQVEGSDRCKWFTVFRHPVSRLVSAFFYCKYMNRKDPLCAQYQIDLNTIDLLSFAEHWGNYGLRQFIFGFYSNEDMLQSPVVRECEQCPGWYIVKRYLQSTQGNPSTGSTDEQSLYQLLTPALEIISSKYAAVGILEEMPTTMRLFNSALGMNHFNWTVALQRAGQSNSDKRLKDEEHEAVREALTDPAIIKFVSLDIILYEHAMNVYKRQLREYGLDQI